MKLKEQKMEFKTLEGYCSKQQVSVTDELKRSLDMNMQCEIHFRSHMMKKITLNMKELNKNLMFHKTFY